MLWFKQKSFRDMESVMPFDEIRKKARIIVIDDDPSAFPYELLQKEGYNVTHWLKVERLRDLESGEYDLIILDIFGVAQPPVSTSDGLGILQHLKKHNPAQLIIAFSGKKYDLTQAEFWKLADDSLGKPADLITCKEKIDSLLKNHFTPQRYWNELERILKNAGISDKGLKKIEQKVITALEAGKKPTADPINSYVSLTASSINLINSLLQILNRFYT